MLIERTRRPEEGEAYESVEIVDPLKGQVECAGSAPQEVQETVALAEHRHCECCVKRIGGEPRCCKEQKLDCAFRADRWSRADGPYCYIRNRWR